MQKIASMSGEHSIEKDKIINQFSRYFEHLKKTNKFDSV